MLLKEILILGDFIGNYTKHLRNKTSLTQTF